MNVAASVEEKKADFVYLLKSENRRIFFQELKIVGTVCMLIESSLKQFSDDLIYSLFNKKRLC